MPASLADLMPMPLDPGAFGIMLTFAGLYAMSLWHGAHRTAQWLERTPRPVDAPRRRALNPCKPGRAPALHLGALAALGADFHAIATANPTRRLEDKTAFLRRLAKRYLVAAVALVAIASSVFLGA
jgi:hypothetical protein